MGKQGKLMGKLTGKTNGKQGENQENEGNPMEKQGKWKVNLSKPKNKKLSP